MPGSRERVVARPAIVLRWLPARRYEPLMLEPIKRRVERPLIQPERPARALLEPFRDSPPVHGPELDCFQHEHVERPLEEIVVRVGHGFFGQSKGEYRSLLSADRWTGGRADIGGTFTPRLGASGSVPFPRTAEMARIERTPCAPSGGPM